MSAPLFFLPLAFATIFIVGPGMPLYAHPLVFTAVAVWGLCAYAMVANFSRAFSFNLPAPICWLAAVLCANALFLGNSYGQYKVLVWMGTCLPLILWPVLAGITARSLESLAWGQLLAGIILLPMLVASDREFYGPTQYISIALVAGLATVSGITLARSRNLSVLGSPTSLLVVSLTVVGAGGLALSGARGGIIALLLALVVFPLVYGVRSAWILGWLALVLVAAGWFAPSIVETQAEIAGERFAEDALGVGVLWRLAMGMEAIDLFLGSPLVGIGAGRFADIGWVDRADLQYPHNIIFELSAEFGIVALAIMAFILARAVRAMWELRLESRSASAFGLASLVFLFANALKMGDLASHRALYLFIGVALAVRETQLRAARLTRSDGRRSQALDQTPRRSDAT